MRVVAIICAAILAGCAAEPQYQWVKNGGDPDSFETDLGYCRAQAFGTANVTLMQAAIVQTSCLRGKGWRQVQVR